MYFELSFMSFMPIQIAIRESLGWRNLVRGVWANCLNWWVWLTSETVKLWWRGVLVVILMLVLVLPSRY